MRPHVVLILALSACGPSQSRPVYNHDLWVIDGDTPPPGVCRRTPPCIPVTEVVIDGQCWVPVGRMPDCDRNDIRRDGQCFIPTYTRRCDGPTD